MIRIVAVALLMLVQLAGPSVCCCAFGRLPTPAPGVPSSVTSSVTPSGHECCGHHSPKSADEHGPKTPKSPDDSPCPCQQGSGKAGAVLTSDSDATKVLRHFSEDQFTVLSYLVPVAGISLARPAQLMPNAVGSRFLTTDDILHACHILRC